MKTTRITVVVSGLATFALLIGYTLFSPSFDERDPNARVAQSAEPAEQSGEGAISTYSQRPVQASVANGPVPDGPFLLAEQMAQASPRNYPTTDAMIQAAEDGDNIASWLVFQSANRCAQRPQSLSRIEELSGNAPPEVVNKMLDDYDRDEMLCSVLPEAVVANRVDYLQRAAERGDINAQLQFLQTVPDDAEVLRNPGRLIRFREDARRFLHSAVAAGSVDAMVELGHQYHNGLFSEEAGAQVLAAALLDAADRSGLSDSSGQVYELWSRELEPEQVARAEALAEQIITRCCH